ncbi:metal ABC transporter solute-binding protein, Zn/Mn family [Microcella frigidaquae]|uniref:Zinc/manganese transport system substrate-binding protein n=1 Tax=Microcella frigidaquae TaxID=424758 RepID=A0A840XHQ4_9MICO|nr:zinc ABC transporter substrate-binding protein [Microcella frigidaquae]MBB5618032.1 zinc/manganese transport system substrate-binding protein [Microcella frigidaquae]NHN44256.1 zinc ABC transporter solute-binding protein [Microcella frigidaquae]
MTSTRRALPALLVASAAGLALTGCAAPAPADEATGLSVVASTNVYGDVAAAIAGDAATVTSIIDSPTIDPHSYEASAQDQLVISTADLIIENGGGYDPFVDVLVEGSGTEAVVISAVVVGGLLEEGEDAHSHSEEEAHAEEESHADEAHSGEEAHSEDDGHGHLEGTNEHVWYDIHVMEDVAAAIATELAALDPENATVFEQNLTAFQERLEGLEALLEETAATLGGGVVAKTETVPAYLLAELGFDDATPDAFTEAIEEGADVPPLALQQVLDLIDSGEVRLLGYNEQTASPETERVRAAAEAAGIPVVSFVETLPEGEDYISWMRLNIEAVAAALAA